MIHKSVLAFARVILAVMAVILAISPLTTCLRLTGSPVALAGEKPCWSDGMLGSFRAWLSARIGGIELNRAATFIGNMDDIKGAYYDASQDQVVFVGHNNIAVPRFDKDDLAVAIRAIVFNGTIPTVSMERSGSATTQNVVYVGGIEDTNFGQVMFEADDRLKSYSQGYEANQQPLVSTVPAYKSFWQGYRERGLSVGDFGSRWWISPREVLVERNDTAQAFVFRGVTMQVETEPLSANNSAAWNAAAQEFAQNQTEHYDEYAVESPAYARAKELAKIVGVVKWLRDNNIATDFSFARSYQPEFVSTPREVPIRRTPEVDIGGGNHISISGGVTYDTPSTYQPDDGSAVATKNAAEAAQPVGSPVHWAFSQSGQQYEAVAVSADAFRSLGAYATSVEDFGIPSVGDNDLSLQRTYSSYSGAQYGIGIGWDILPARLTNLMVGFGSACTPPNGYPGGYPFKLALQTASGGRETFTYFCDFAYHADDPAYHSQLARNPDGTFVARLKDQQEYRFDADMQLQSRRDKNGNEIIYSYDDNDNLVSIGDGYTHSLAISYGSRQLVSSVSDWSGRTVRYGYNSDGNLTSVTDPRGGKTSYSYNELGQLTSITDREGHVTISNTYNVEGKLATQTDASGKTISFSYDPGARSITASDDLGRTTRLVYDDKARVTESTDGLGNSTRFTYGNELTPLTSTDPLGRRTANEYDSRGNLTAQTFPDNSRILLEYDGLNRPTRILDGRYSSSNAGNPKETRLTYDQNGNVVQTNEAGLVTNYEYDSYGELVHKTQGAQGWTYLRDLFGNVLLESAPLNSFFANQYDAVGRLTGTTDADGKTLSYTYDTNDNVLTQEDAAGSTRNTYSLEGRLTQVTNPGNATTRYAHDPSGQLTDVTDASGNPSAYSYDSYQNLIEQRDPLQNVSEFEYDAANRQTKSTTALGKQTEWRYDANGNVVTRIDPQGRATTYRYNGMDRLTAITYPDAATVTMTYDARGNLTELHDRIGTTRYTYDVFDRLTAVTDPYSQTAAYQYDVRGNLTRLTYPGNRSMSYVYDEANHLQKASDWNGKDTLYSYTDAGLLQTKTLPNGIESAYLYDDAGRISQLRYNNAQGHTVASFAYQRDALGNVTRVVEDGEFFGASIVTPTPGGPPPTPSATSQSIATPSSTQAVVLSPTPSFAATATALGSTATNTPRKDVTNTPSPTSVPGLTPTTVATATSASTPATSPTATPHPTGPPNSTATARPTSTARLTPTPRPTLTPGNGQHIGDVGCDGSVNSVDAVLVLQKNAGLLSTLKCQENADVNLDGRISSLDAALILQFDAGLIGQLPPSNVGGLMGRAGADQPGVSSFFYDTLNRLTSGAYPEKSYSFSYDAGDNLSISSSSSESFPTTYDYDADNELVRQGLSTLVYDANGNLINHYDALDNKMFSYDFDQHLIQYSETIGGSSDVTNYAYDGLGKRLQKVRAGRTTRYVNDLSGSLERVITETDSSNSATNYLTYGVDPISQGGATTTERAYLVADAQGSTRFVTDSTGQLIASYQYEPFGSLRGSSGADPEGPLFAGEHNDAESGMYYLRARRLDPATKRFTTRDPVPNELTRPTTLNRYIYVGNNPVNFTDPSGSFWETAWDIANVGLDVYTCNWGALAFDTGAALIPFVPAGLTKIEHVAPAGKIVQGVRNVDSGSATFSKALRTAEEWLGPGYREIDSGVFRSADNQRQFRITSGDHVNFEAIAPDGTHIENSHVDIIDR
jgi:RHS repeat-associated protein